MSTIRFPHLENESPLKVGDKLKKGDYIGEIGNTGQSFGIHLHLDAVKERVKGCWRSHQIKSGKFTLDEETIKACCNYNLFRGPLTITYFVDDPRYTKDMERHGLPNKLHKGYDLLGKGPIYFPLDDGTVISKYFDAPGYGHTVHIYFEG